MVNRTGLTPEMIIEGRKIADTGVGLTTIAAHMGTTRRTLFRWLEHGRAYLDAMADDPADADEGHELHAELYLQIAFARGEKEQIAVLNLLDPDARNSHGSETWLANMIPSDWKNNKDIDILQASLLPPLQISEESDNGTQ